MPLYLSASSIADYLDCSQRFFYRTTQREQGISSDDQLVGTIVHYAIEKYWDNEPLAREEVDNQVAFFNLPPTKAGKAKTAVDTFFDRFVSLLSSEDEIEYKFKLPLEKDVFLVGKMDRISNGNIFDWKTTATPPNDISKDIQFIIYNEAFRRTFKKDPTATYYASLINGKLIKLRVDKALTDILFNDIIPSMTHAIKNKEYTRTGLFTGKCFKCGYQEICYKECNYELASTRFTK